jgi:hypothetical protein
MRLFDADARAPRTTRTNRSRPTLPASLEPSWRLPFLSVSDYSYRALTKRSECRQCLFHIFIASLPNHVLCFRLFRRCITLSLRTTPAPPLLRTTNHFRQPTKAPQAPLATETPDPPVNVTSTRASNRRTDRTIRAASVTSTRSPSAPQRTGDRIDAGDELRLHRSIQTQ